MADDFPRITDIALAALRARVGNVVPRPQPYIETATEDAIRHWTMGIGDRNPLYLDPAYAQATGMAVRSPGKKRLARMISVSCACTCALTRSR